MAKKEQPRNKDDRREVSLVPLYSPLDVTRGIQAYRRGDLILYTVRGEPSKVQELIGELDRRGVGEVVALVSHRAPGQEETGEEEPEKAEKEGPQDNE